MLRPLHFDRAVMQTSKISNAVCIDVVTFDLAGPRNAFKPGKDRIVDSRGRPRPAASLPYCRRDGRIARWALYWRDWIPPRAGAVSILPQDDQAVVVDATAATRFVTRSCRVICRSLRWMSRIYHGVERGVFLAQPKMTRCPGVASD